MNVNFEKATTEDAEKLTKISVNSFNTDFDHAGRDSIGGPPGYDSTEFHERMIEEATKFYKITIDSHIIGGFWFIEESFEKAYLYRIFIDSKYHNKGIGLQSFNFLFQNFSSIKEWSLQTPIWNTRTSKFYKKLGFVVTEKTDRFSFLKRK